MSNGLNFIQLLTKAGPTILSAGGVAAVIWLAIEIVPEERRAMQEERTKTRELYIVSMEKHRQGVEQAHADHAEIMKKLDALLRERDQPRQ